MFGHTLSYGALDEVLHGSPGRVRSLEHLLPALESLVLLHDGAHHQQPAGAVRRGVVVDVVDEVAADRAEQGAPVVEVLRFLFFVDPDPEPES